MTTWDDFETSERDLALDAGCTPEDAAGDLHDREQALADAELDAILAGDADAAAALHEQWLATEDAADHADWAAQDLEWAGQSAAEAEADATDAAEAASMHLPESAEKIAGMAGIAGESAAASMDAAIDEYQQSIAALDAAAAADAASEADEPYDAEAGGEAGAAEPYDADAGGWSATDGETGDDLG